MVGRNRMRAIIILIYLFVSFTQAFSQEIKGKVVDESNQPLPFVSIIEENTQNYARANKFEKESKNF